MVHNNPEGFCFEGWLDAVANLIRWASKIKPKGSSISSIYIYFYIFIYFCFVMYRLRNCKNRPNLFRGQML